MTRLLCLFAQLDVTRELLHQRQSWGGFNTTDTLLILGFVFLLVVALFSWAYFIRKRPKDQHGSRALVRPHRSRRSRHSHSRWAIPSETQRRVRVKHRRRRQRSESEKHRNPTLGETGGLPPLRPEEPEEPPAAQSQT